MSILKGLMDDKLLRILSVFMSNPKEYYHINKVSDDSKVPISTTFRIMNTLLENNLIEYKAISKFRIYKLADNNKTKKLGKML